MEQEKILYINEFVNEIRKNRFCVTDVLAITDHLYKDGNLVDTRNTFKSDCIDDVKNVLSILDRKFSEKYTVKFMDYNEKFLEEQEFWNIKDLQNYIRTKYSNTTIYCRLFKYLVVYGK